MFTANFESSILNSSSAFDWISINLNATNRQSALIKSWQSSNEDITFEGWIISDTDFILNLEIDSLDSERFAWEECLEVIMQATLTPVSLIDGTGAYEKVINSTITTLSHKQTKKQTKPKQSFYFSLFLSLSR